MTRSWDAVVIGAGPNGLAAAITIARAGRSVLLLEARATIGGGVRSLELTLPGVKHDVCSAVYPLARASPFLRSLPLSDHGLTWIDSRAPLAHPFDDGTAVLLERSVEDTARGLDADEDAYVELVTPFVAGWTNLVDDILAPLHIPHHPLFLAQFGLHGTRSALDLARTRFSGERARSLFAGIAAHSFLPLDRSGSGALGLVLLLSGHASGWPIAEGGSQRLADALASYLRALGGEIRTDTRVGALEDIPSARAALFDVTPRQLLEIAGPSLPSAYRKRLERFRYGPGVFKIDWALSEAVPWKADAVKESATVHLGGGIEEIALSEKTPAENEHAPRPFVIFVQPSLFDDRRAPGGVHTAWAYCHVPQGSTVDMTERIEAQVERFAPGFRDVVIARSTRNTRDLEAYNENLVGGEIMGGSVDLAQLFRRPRLLRPYSIPIPGLYLCSSSTPPGPGVHGMCGYFAAVAALAQTLT